jgi:hypothetical protein
VLPVYEVNVYVLYLENIYFLKGNGNFDFRTYVLKVVKKENY